MSWPAIRWARHQKAYKASDRAVLGMLAHYARLKDARAWPSLATLAEDCGMCTKAVGQTIRGLADRGLLVIEGYRYRRKYRLCLDAGNKVPAAKGAEGEGTEFPTERIEFPRAGTEFPRSYKDPNRKGRGRRGTTAAAAAAAAGSGNETREPWSARLQAYRDKGFWYADWGPQPGEEGCRAPQEMLKRFGFMQADVKSK